MTEKKSRFGLFGGHPHRNLFLTMIAFFGAAVMLPEQVIGGRLYDYMVAGILLAALVETAVGRRNTVIALVFGIPAVGLRLVYAELEDSVPISSWLLGLSALFFAFLIWNLLRDLLAADRSTSERVFGALTAYLCVGMLFALIYAHTHFRDPGSFKIPEELLPAGPQTEAMMVPVFTYFSFVTLTTLGYGDFVPISEQTRTLAWLEAVIGQLYLAVLVGGLVGVFFAEAAKQATAADFRKRLAEDDKPQIDDTAE